MKNKKIVIIVLIVVALIISTLIVGFVVINKNNNKIPDGYIAVFHGGYGEVTHATYIYKKNNGHDNFGFNYINVTYMTSSWGSSELNATITKRGSVMWTGDVFGVAKENDAYSYVTLPNSDKVYTIDEFVMMFSMD